MKQDKFFIRFIISVVGLFIMAFGIALSLQSLLGTTPIISIPFVFSFIGNGKITVGQFSILLNFLFFILQVLFLGKNFNKILFLQLLLIVLLGWFIDVNNVYLMRLITVPVTFITQWGVLFISSLIIAIGIFFQVKSDLVLLPSEGFVMALSKKYQFDFGISKIILDLLLVVIAAASSFIFLHKLQGIREGTIVIGVLVGFIVQFLNKNIKIDFSGKDSTSSDTADSMEPYMQTSNFVITIAREFGSGGHAIGEIVAQKLGISFYDSALIDLTAEASGLTAEYVKKNEQKQTHNLLYQLYKQNFAYINEVIPPRDLLFLIQTKIIRDIAAKESCVIVGRNADYILKGHPNCFNVFVHANKTFRLNRVITDYGIDLEFAEREMEKKDKERIYYTKYYTQREWEDMKNYDMTIESSMFGIDITAAMIIDARRKALFTKS